MAARLLACAMLLIAARAHAQHRAWLVARTGHGPFDDAPVQARLGEEVEVHVVLRAPDGRLFSDLERIGGRRPDGPLPEGARVDWARVLPRYQHYSNVVQWGVLQGEWRGIERLLYMEEPLRPSHEIAIDGAVLRLRGRGQGAGTAWIAAQITLADGRIVRTPGATSTDRLGIERSVLRVSFRGGDDFLGWLASYFGVPFVFGSVSRQVDRYTGADCADVLIGALRASGRGLRYVSVAGISRYARAISEVLTFDRRGRLRGEDGELVVLRWGTDVRPGDLVAIDYETLGRRWDHIGALVSDDGDGALDGADLLRNMTMYGLADRPLGEEGAIRARVWRWRPTRARVGP